MLFPSRVNMPYDWENTTRKISFYRKFYSNKYSLNSAINMTIKDLFRYHGLKSFDNFLCGYVYVQQKFFKFTKKFFLNNIKVCILLRMEVTKHM